MYEGQNMMNGLLLVCMVIAIFGLGGLIALDSYQNLMEESPCSNPYENSCKELSSCFKKCDNKGFLTHAADCRDRLEPYIIVRC